MGASDIADEHFEGAGVTSADILDAIFNFIDEQELTEDFKEYLQKNHKIIFSEEDVDDIDDDEEEFDEAYEEDFTGFEEE